MKWNKEERIAYGKIFRLALPIIIQNLFSAAISSADVIMLKDETIDENQPYEIFDPEFIQKWSHVPFAAQSLDLKKAGIRNTDALVLTEASCLTLRYPAAHMRIVPTA